MNEAASLIRYNNLIIATIAILETVYLSQIALSFQIIVLIIVILSFMASGYITNDILDYETDLINEKKRPLIIKSITRNKAKRINLCMIFCGVLFSLFLNVDAQIVLYMILLPLLYLYNYYFKFFFIFGNLIISFLIGMIFIFSELVILQSYSLMIIPATLAFFLTLIREIIKDLEDLKGDSFKKMYTLPIVFGKKLTIRCLQTIILLFIVLCPLYLSTTLSQSIVYIVLFIILIEFPLLYSLFLLRRIPGKKTIYNLSKLYKIIAFNGLLIIPLMKG